MLEIPDLRGKRVTVMGLGLAGGGVGSAKFFCRAGAEVTVTDLRDKDELSESVSALRDFDVALHLGGHSEADFAGADMVVASPAVRPDSAYLALASSRGVRLECPMTLFFPWCPAPIAGVTGTLGKTTVTALTGHIMSKTGKKTWVGGNIGGNPLDFIDDVRSGDAVVLEISSFQLEYLGRARLSPHIAVVTGISPDHMDRYDSMEGYASAKRNILRYQNKDDVAFINAACGTTMEWADDCAGTVYLYDTENEEADVFIRGEEVYFSAGAIASVSGLRIPGDHNRANAAVAAAVSSVMGAGREAVDEGLSTFQGVAHRMERVAETDGILFYNDSAATTPEAAIAAIDAAEGPVALILGGSDKGLEMAELVAACVEGVEKIVLIGESTDALMEVFKGKDEGYTERSVSSARSMHEAVKTAAASLRHGTVLLSPAHASFDMFRNYMDRAECFKDAVYSLSSSNSSSGTALSRRLS